MSTPTGNAKHAQAVAATAAKVDELRTHIHTQLGVVVRLERIAEWVRAGHHPPPPFTPEEIVEYIYGEAPDLHEEADGA